jgi:hypothetical protein
VMLSLLATLIGIIGIFVAGDWDSFRKFVESLRLGYGLGLLYVVLGNLFSIASPILLNRYINRIFTLWQNHILDATDSMASLNDFEDWLNTTCNWRLHFLVTIIAVILLTLSGIFILTPRLGLSLGYGLIASIFVISMFLYAFVYLFLMIILLSARLHGYDLKLFAADPSSSDLISRLSGELGFVIYIVAIYGIIGFISFGLLPGLIDPIVVFVQVFLVWLPITALFILIQTSLSNIIRRVKRKTLNEIQMKVEKLQTSKNFGNQETMDAIKRLMDYHDRVKATRDSALDFRTYLSFFNSLLLPLLAFLIGNLDLVFKLFGIKP